MISNVILAILIAIFLLFLKFLFNIVFMQRDIAVIKMEINRAYSEDEYLYWKHELRKLYLSAMPFYHIFKG